jgi:chemotaxis protein MotB
MAEAATRPIIVIKKKGGHAGHHGGAWKVAYADFVTAMMALFIVLWLLNSSKQVREAVGGYFKDPTGNSKKVGNGQTGSGDNFTLSKDNMSKLKEELQKAVRKVANFDQIKNHIEMTVTSEGLRIELLESDAGTFFQSGAPEPTDSGKELLKRLAEEVGKLPNKVLIEGHTDAKPFSPSSSYSNWELSADRANAARRWMQQDGIRPDQVTQVRGYADQRLRKPDQPHDPSNRRISLIVQYQSITDAADKEAEEQGSEEKGSEKKSAEKKESAGKSPEKNESAEKPSPAKPSEHAAAPHGHS